MAATRDTVNVPLIVYANQTGPNPYAAGGFLIDLTASLTFIRFLSISLEVRGTNVSDEYEVTPNRDLSGAFAPGKAVIKLFKDRYDEASVTTSITSLPGGVTAQSVKFAAATTTGSTHSHTINHDHGSETSSQPVAGGNGANAVVGGLAIDTHTHTVDIANFTGSTATDGSHTHDRSFEYEHSHPITSTETNVTLVEPTGSNLSGTTFRVFAVGD